MNKPSFYDQEEQLLIESVEKEEWQPLGDLQQKIAEAKEIAANTIQKNERMNIRINGKDLRSLKAKAIEAGMPYQTLVSSILHKYVTGQLREQN